MRSTDRRAYNSSSLGPVLLTISFVFAATSVQRRPTQTGSWVSTPVGGVVVFFLLLLFMGTYSLARDTSTPLSLTLSIFSAANTCFSGALRNWRVPLPKWLEWALTRTWAAVIGRFWPRHGGSSSATVATHA